METKARNIQTHIRRLRRVVLAVGGGGLLAAILLVAFLPYDERIIATGSIRAESDTFLYAPEDGVLKTTYVQEGDRVKKDQPVLGLDDSHLRRELKQIEAALTHSRSELSLQKIKLERTLKLPLPRDFWHMEEERSISRERLRQAEVEAQRQTNLFDRGLVSQQDLERVQLAVKLAQSETSKTADKAGIIDQGLEVSILNEAKALIDEAGTALHEFEVRRDVIRERIADCTVKAPEAGVVTLLAKTRPGEAVAQGDELAHLAHGPANKIDLYVGESQVNRLRPGQRVVMESLTFDALRHGYIEGEIQRVPLEPSRTVEKNGEISSEYRLKAIVLSTPAELVLGSSVRAKIILRRIPLWTLLFPESMRTKKTASPTDPPSTSAFEAGPDRMTESR